MHRPLRGLAALLAALLVAGACGQTAPTLTDPTEILTKSVETMADAKSVRIDVTLSGSVAADPFETGTGSNLTLDGTSLSADVDLANGAARVTFTVPALFGLLGELIAVGDDVYVKTSLTGSLYQWMTAADSPLPLDPSEVDGIDLDGLREFLAKPELAPVKGDDVRCGTRDCYAVSIELTPEKLAALGGTDVPDLDLPLELGDAAMTLDVQVDRETLRMAAVSLSVALGAEGSFRLDVSFSEWDAQVSIAPPPPAEIAP